MCKVIKFVNHGEICSSFGKAIGKILFVCIKHCSTNNKVVVISRNDVVTWSDLLNFQQFSQVTILDSEWYE